MKCPNIHSHACYFNIVSSLYYLLLSNCRVITALIYFTATITTIKTPLSMLQINSIKLVIIIGMVESDASGAKVLSIFSCSHHVEYKLG